MKNNIKEIKLWKNPSTDIFTLTVTGIDTFEADITSGFIADLLAEIEELTQEINNAPSFKEWFDNMEE